MSDLLYHHNHNYIGGSPNLPISVGDRYYDQDLIRDFWFLMQNTGLAVKGLIGQIPILISGGEVSKGAGNTLNITACVGYAKYDVTVLNNTVSWALPPTVHTETLDAARVESSAQTNMAIPSATLDNVTTNYVKLRYTEDDNSQTRVRAKKSGSYAWAKKASYEFVVDSVAPTDYDIVLAEFISVAGAVPATMDTSNRSPYLLRKPTQNIVSYSSSQTLTITRDAEIHGTAGANGIRFTLPATLSDDMIGVRLRIIKDDDTDTAVTIYGNGNNIGNLDYFFLIDEDQFIEIEWNGTSWDICHAVYVFDTGGINTSDWTSRKFGTMEIPYDNKSTTAILIGDTVTEATSNNTWIVVADSGGTGTSGTIKCWKATGTGYATDGRQLSFAQTGITADVNSVPDTKNVDTEMYHGFDMNLIRFDFRFTYYPGTTYQHTASRTLPLGGNASGSSSICTYYQVDSNNIRMATSLVGCIGQDGAGNNIALNTQDYSYRIRGKITI